MDNENNITSYGVLCDANENEYGSIVDPIQVIDAIDAYDIIVGNNGFDGLKFSKRAVGTMAADVSRAISTTVWYRMILPQSTQTRRKRVFHLARYGNGKTKKKNLKRLSKEVRIVYEQ